MEMKKYKLSEIGEIRMCKRILKEETNSVGGVPFFKIGTFGGQADVFITKEKFKEYKNAYSYPKKGDILISAAGTIGRTVVFDGKDAYFQDSNIVWIENDESKVLNEYLFYCYKNIRWTTSVGSTILRLYNDDIRNTDIIVPHLSEQKKISSVLSSLDDKIALNKKINAKLEAMAKRLYDYWFVQFDYPDKNGKPYKTSGGKMVWNEVLKREIPEGWEVKKLGEVVELLKDGTHNPPSRVENGIALLTGTMFGENFLDYTKATYIAKEDYFIIHSKYEPLENDIIITKIGTLGNINILRDIDIPIAIHCNSALLRFQNTFGFYYPFFFCKSALFQLRLKSVKGQSIQEFASLDKIASILCEIPKDEILISFNKTVKPIMKQMIRISKEIKKLTDLRDRLLPLLMNGQVEVEG